MYESDFEERLYNERRETLKAIAALGQQTYPNSYDFTQTIPQLRLEFGARTGEELEAERIEVSIAGRLMAKRLQGKAGFAVLQQGDVKVELEHPELEGALRMQIYVRKDDVGEDGFALYKLLDLGDHIGVKGYLMRTRTGELTVHVSSLTFLAKAMLALPDKFHGLEDIELRYRRRYLDLFTDTGDWVTSTNIPYQNRFPARKVFVKRAAVLRTVRTFFDSRGYIEVETPMMHTIAGGAAARPFTTHHNALDVDLKLRIAPELYLKRLVVGGMDRVYEINRNFRNEGVSTQHNPEFTMLEFYQAYANYHDLMNLTMELIATVAREVNDGSTVAPLLWDEDGRRVDLTPENWRKLSMREAIIKFWPEEMNTKPTAEIFGSGVSFLNLLSIAEKELVDCIGRTEPFFSNETGRAFGAALNYAIVELPSDNSYPGKAIATLFEGLAEEHLIQPTIIYDFPLAVSPLSKVKPDEPEWVERFEFYIGGFEVGNAFSELNDPDDQRARFEAQLKERERGDDEAHQMDEDYVRALGYGLPPTAGEGIGIDRLTMILTGAKSIRDVILFPLLRPVAKAAVTE